MVGVAGAIVSVMLRLLLADRASANIASSAEEDVMSDRGCHRCGRGSPGRFAQLSGPQGSFDLRPGLVRSKPTASGRVTRRTSGDPS
jgi:hypothetical protein